MHVHPHVRILLTKPPDRRRQGERRAVEQAVDDSNVKPTGGLAPDSLDPLGAAVDGVEQFLRRRQQRLPFLRQPEAAAPA